VTAAGRAGADFTTIVTLASGNRELQTHVDLVMTRTQRLFSRTKKDEDLAGLGEWALREILTYLEADDRASRGGPVSADLHRVPRGHRDHAFRQRLLPRLNRAPRGRV